LFFFCDNLIGTGVAEHNLVFCLAITPNPEGWHMFNFSKTDWLPGFRVGVPEDVPGFRMNSDGTVRTGSVNISGFGGGSPSPIGLSEPWYLWDLLSKPKSQDLNGGEVGLPSANEPIVPVADPPRAANDNPVCNHAYGRCMATARMTRLPPDAYARFIQECRSVYELCLQRENDPQRVGRDGDFFELPDGARLIFRRGHPPQYIPNPKNQPAWPYIPPDYDDPTQFN
jgi:hypothetical protein